MFDVDMDRCEACGRDCDVTVQAVPGDRNAAWVCLPCAHWWQHSHVWDDAAGEWVERPRGARPHATREERVMSTLLAALERGLREGDADDVATLVCEASDTFGPVWFTGTLGGAR